MERKCPRCGSLAAREGSGTSTLLGWQPYYDKDGVYHNEDPNIHTINYTCSDCGQNYSISTRYGESELHWQKDDVNKLEDLFYNPTPSTGEDRFTGNLIFGDITVGSGDTNLQYIQNFQFSNSRTKMVISNEVDIEIKHNDKTYTIDIDLLLQFLAAQGMVKDINEKP